MRMIFAQDRAQAMCIKVWRRASHLAVERLIMSGARLLINYAL